MVDSSTVVEITTQLQPLSFDSFFAQDDKALIIVLSEVILYSELSNE